MLTEKVILITGGARRIGAIISKSFASAGAQVIIHYHNSQIQAQQLCSELEKSGHQIDSVRADLSKLDEINKMYEAVINKHKRIDALICNASTFIHTPFFSATEADWDRIINTNLKANFFLCQLIGKQMISQKSGKIVLISDVGAEESWPHYLPYTISKAGVNHLVKGLAKILAPYVQVNGLAPGTILPPKDATEKEINSYKKKNLLNRIGNPDDIAKTILFLLTASDFITGAIIPVDGGYSVKGR